MFIREKRIGSYSYLYLVETVREEGKTKQRIIRNLGRKEAVKAGGDLDRLARSAARLSQRSMILSLIEDGSAPDVACWRIGAPLLFERLWQESGCRAVVERLVAGRRFEFAVERAGCARNTRRFKRRWRHRRRGGTPTLRLHRSPVDHPV